MHSQCVHSVFTVCLCDHFVFTVFIVYSQSVHCVITVRSLCACVITLCSLCILCVLVVCRLKLHEDWGSTPAAINTCLTLAEDMDFQVRQEKPVL